MKAGYLFKNTFRMILSRKGNFLISLILLCIAFVIVDEQAIVVGSCYYQNNAVKDIMAENWDDVFLLDYEKYLNPTNEDIGNLNRFGILMKEVDGIRYSGAYHEYDFGLEGAEARIMAISADIMPLCQLKNVEGNDISFTDAKKGKALPGSRRDAGRTEEKTPVLVGYHLKDEYPIGYSFSDEYVVTDILQEGSRWLADRLEFGEFEVDLDDCLVIDQDSLMKTGGAYLEGTTSYICVKEPDADADQIKEALTSLASECGLDLYNVRSVNKIMSNNIKSAFSDAIEFYLVILMLILAVVVAVVCSVINVYLRKNSIGVMYAVGYSTKDVQRMTLLENVIKIGMAFCVAYAYWSVKETEIYEMNVSILAYMLPWLVAGAIIIIGISSFWPIRKLSKMYPATLIGGKE